MSKNSATKCGILNINDLRHCSVKFIDSSFVNNSANASSGGVLCIRNASISVQNVTFSHNGVAENGGVFAVDDIEMIIQNSFFYNNVAGINGGVY